MRSVLYTKRAEMTITTLIALVLGLLVLAILGWILWKNANDSNTTVGNLRDDAKIKVLEEYGCEAVPGYACRMNCPIGSPSAGCEKGACCTEPKSGSGS